MFDLWPSQTHPLPQKRTRLPIMVMIMTAHKDISQNRKSVVNPVAWSSKKTQKVAVMSTLSAEAMALAGTMDYLAWRRLYWG